MKVDERIPREVIQLFSIDEASEYRLLPCFFNVKTRVLQCYGKEGVDYSSIIKEVSVIQNLNIEVVLISDIEFERVFNLYYRKGTSVSSGMKIDQINDDDFVNALIWEADSIHSSDIHLEPYEERCRIRMRIDGKLIERYVIDLLDYPALVNRIKLMANLKISEKRLPQDGRILFEKANKKFDVRVSILPTIYGEKIVLRLLTREQGLLDLTKLGFTDKQYDDYTQAILNPNGLVLITGPTGSGKSTTLYATLRLLNREDNNILTIEDPVEYTLPGINQVQLKEEIGLTFSSALRTFLRQDPDIIMLGEIRDQDTAEMAIRSSLTGHLLLSTIHTNSAWGSVARLTDMGVHSYLIADTLIACVAQRLIRLLCPHCKEEYKLDSSAAQLIGVKVEQSYYKAKGCASCYYTGYSGRKAIYEVIKIDSVLSQAIRDNEREIEKYLTQNHVSTLMHSALTLLESGETSLDEVLPILNNTI
jgi:type IV pilus assembly protein PilB